MTPIACLGVEFFVDTNDILSSYIQVLTHWHLGNPVTNPAEIEALTPTNLLTQSSPCSGNIWVLSPVVEREIYIAVSYRAFTEPHYSWYKLTPLITKVCL